MGTGTCPSTWFSVVDVRVIEQLLGIIVFDQRFYKDRADYAKRRT